MKKSTFLIALLLTIGSLNARSITGSWHATLEVPGAKLRLVFHISESNGTFTTLMDSPDQGVKGIPMSLTTYEKNELVISAPQMGMTYTGALSDDGKTINGTFKQGGFSTALNLSKSQPESTSVAAAPARPQEPKPPFPYISEDVVFDNEKANVRLAGTFTKPAKEGTFPTVILITGSGPQNRDEEVFGHKPFLVIADYLTRNGVAVLRYDDRGVAQSTGSFEGSTTRDFADDANAAVEYLKTRNDVDLKRIGLLGHSEGGRIAPMVANENNAVSCVILLAGPAVSGAEVMLLQQQLILKMQGATPAILQQTYEANKAVFDMINTYNDPAVLNENLHRYLMTQALANSEEIAQAGQTLEEHVNQSMQRVLDPWMLHFLRDDPTKDLSTMKCPAFALFGEKDLQVAPSQNTEKMRQLLKNPKSEVKIYPKLNHLFQHCETGNPNRYAEIEETISAEVLRDIINFIQAK